jgi:hypothetical protein
MKHSRDWAARAIKEDRAWQVLGGERSGRLRKLSSLTPGMIEFVDPRPRDNQGQYVANETGGVDPNSMQAAYGNVEAEKQQRRSMISQRLKQMLGTG